MVAGDFNVHNPATNPSQVFSYSEELASASFHDQASDLDFRLLNTLGVYTCFPLSGSQSLGVIDLAFTNSQMSFAFSAWDASTLPSTGFDHVPILITLASSTKTPLPKTLYRDSTDWEVLCPRLDMFRTPLAPSHPSPAQLEEWFSTSLNSLTVLIRNVTPLSRPSPRSKPWWTPLLTTLRKEYNKAMHTIKKHHSNDTVYLAKLSKLGYFKVIKRAKSSYWLEFLARTTSQNI